MCVTPPLSKHIYFLPETNAVRLKDWPTSKENKLTHEKCSM